MISRAPLARYTPRVHRLPEIAPEDVGNLKADWRNRMACGELLFEGSKEALKLVEYSTKDYALDEHDQFRQVCAMCPVSDWCVADALADRSSQGIRGGFYFIMGGLDQESREMVKKQYNVNAKPVPGSH